MSLTMKRLDDSVVQVEPEHLKVLEWGLQKRQELKEKMEALKQSQQDVDDILIDTFRGAGIKSVASNDYGTIVFKAGSKGRSSFDRKAFTAYLLDGGVSADLIAAGNRKATKLGKPGNPSVAYYSPSEEEEDAN